MYSYILIRLILNCLCINEFFWNTIIWMFCWTWCKRGLSWLPISHIFCSQLNDPLPRGIKRQNLSLSKLISRGSSYFFFDVIFMLEKVVILTFWGVSIIGYRWSAFMWDHGNSRYTSDDDQAHAQSIVFNARHQNSMKSDHLNGDSGLFNFNTYGEFEQSTK